MAYQPYISLTFLLRSCLLLSLYHPHLVPRLHTNDSSPSHHPKLCVLPASILLITLNGKVIYPIGFNPCRLNRSYPVIPLVTTLHSSDSAVPQAFTSKLTIVGFNLSTYIPSPAITCNQKQCVLLPLHHYVPLPTLAFFLSTTIGSVMCPPADAQGSTPWSLR